MRRHLPNLLLIILVVAGLAFVGTGIYRVYKGKPIIPGFSGTLAQVQQNDRRMLDEGKSSEDEIIKALKRYSFQNQPDAKTFIQEYMSHPSMKVRAAAIEAAGGLNGGPFAKEIDAALAGEVPELRIAAIQAMVRGPREGTLRKLRAERSRPGITEREKFASLKALYRLSGDEKEKSSLIASLAGDPPRDKDVRDETYADIFRLQQRDPVLLKLAQAEIMNPAGDESAFHALNYLREQDKDWLRENMRRIPVRAHAGYQQAMVDFLAKNCVKERDPVVAALKAKSQSPEISRAVADLGPGPSCL